MRTLLFTSLVIISLSASSVFAATAKSSEARMSRADTKTQAVEICRLETQQRYGVDSIKFISEKPSWSKFRFNSKEGVLVKMKVKPEGKRPRNFHCLVNSDKSVDYLVR